MNSKSLGVVLAAVAALSATSGGFAAPRSASGNPSRITLTAHNQPLQSVLLHLAELSGQSISVPSTLSGYVTVRLRNVTLKQALEAVLTPLGDSWHLRDGIYAIEIGATGASLPTSSGVSPTVIPVSVIAAMQAAKQIRALFPDASIRVEPNANALLVVASPSDLQAIHGVLVGIDVKNPAVPVTQAILLQTARADQLAAQLRTSFPKARITPVGLKQLLIAATPSDMSEIRSTVTALDASPTVTPPPTLSSEAVRVAQRSPAEVARTLTHEVHGLQASVSGGTVVLSGTPDQVARAKALLSQVDVPAFNSRYTNVYRIRTIDAGSVADLLRRSFRDIDVTVDASINAIAVTATAALQQRITDAIAQLDPAPGSANAPQGFAGSGASTELVTLKAAVPTSSGNSGPDATTAITQALQAIVPDVKVIQLSTPGQLALVGPPQSLKTAKEFIDKVDVVPPLVVLDTEILEVDETVAKNLGVQLGTSVLSSTFTESTPSPNANTGLASPLGGLGSFGRTPLSFTAQVNLLVQNGNGRVLADPRITTLSGRTASIRAGDTISILTTTAGNAGTIATTQVQSFQTGVTLDITPLVDAEGGITVNLHPVVNSLAGTNNGVPEISTRDTQTTVHLHDDETLVIGGLIQQTDTRTTNKIPLLGDLPLVGHLFRNDQVNGERNELIIVVTPHLVKPGTKNFPGPPISNMPTAAPLPTLPPNSMLPAPTGQFPNVTRSAMSTPTSAPPVAPSQFLASPSPSPAPLPTAFGQTNIFTFGAAPQSNFAKSGDAIQIFYATLAPTVVSSGSQVSVSAITTTNVTSVKLQLGTQTIALSPIGPGQWRSVFPYPATAAPPGQSTLNATLSAMRTDGGSASIPISVNVTEH